MRKKDKDYKNFKEYIMSQIVLIIIVNTFYLINVYRATGFKLNSWTFLYIITGIVVNFLFIVLPYKSKKKESAK